MARITDIMRKCLEGMRDSMHWIRSFGCVQSRNLLQIGVGMATTHSMDVGTATRELLHTVIFLPVSQTPMLCEDALDWQADRLLCPGPAPGAGAMLERMYSLACSEDPMGIGASLPLQTERPVPWRDKVRPDATSSLLSFFPFRVSPSPMCISFVERGLAVRRT